MSVRDTIHGDMHVRYFAYNPEFNALQNCTQCGSPKEHGGRGNDSVDVGLRLLSNGVGYCPRCSYRDTPTDYDSFEPYLSFLFKK